MSVFSRRYYLPPVKIRAFCGLWVAAFSSSFAQTGDPVIPQGYEPERYEPMWKKSPFTLSSVATETTVAGFAENLAFAGVVKINGEILVIVLNKTTQKREFISAKPNSRGIFLARLESGSDLEKTVATLQKGSEVSLLRYDQAFLKSAAQKTAGNPEGPVAAVGNTQKSTPTPEAPPPPPKVRHSRMISSQPGPSNENAAAPSPPPYSSKP